MGKRNPVLSLSKLTVGRNGVEAPPAAPKPIPRTLFPHSLFLTLSIIFLSLGVTTHFFFLKKKKNIQMSHHNGTTTCRLANIWYIPHNMYLIFRVTSMQRIT
jgi:hypothetical protein